MRENVKSALAAARNIYDELIGGRGVTYAATRMATDKDLQDSLRSAVDDLRRAADRVQGKDSHTGRNMTLLVTGIALGLLFNPVTGPVDAPLAVRPGPRQGRVRRHRRQQLEPEPDASSAPSPTLAAGQAAQQRQRTAFAHR